MPSGYPKNPELARIRRSISQKNRVRDVSWHRKVRAVLIKRNKSAEHIEKVKKALFGHGFTEKTLKKMRENHADFNGHKNPNWRGEKVGKIGVHIWLRKYFKKTNICQCCGIRQDGKLGTDWALILNKKYERNRDNFKELCRKCHYHYDKHLHFDIGKFRRRKGENLV